MSIDRTIIETILGILDSPPAAYVMGLAVIVIAAIALFLTCCFVRWSIDRIIESLFK